MRIGIDARFYGSLGKGLGRYTEKLLQELERIQSEDEYVVFLRRENFDEYQPRDSRFSKVLADYPWYGWQEQLLYPRLLRRYRLDLVHFPHFNVPLLYRKPFIVTIHDLILFHFPTVKASELPPFLYWAKYLIYRLVIGQAVRRARRVIAVSQFTADDISRAYPAARSKVTVTLEAAEQYCFWVPPSEIPALLHRYGIARDRPYVLYVGNAYPHKHLELLLDLAAALPAMDFVCVGREDYFYRRLRQESAGRRLANVRFVGYVPDPVLAALYRGARTYCFPSLYEGFGLPGLEALAHGVPVLAARRGALPEVLGDAAVYFDPRSVVSALAALRSVCDDAALRQRLIWDGYARSARFSWARMAEATLREYHDG